MAQDKIVFVLWADRFDETLAALFVAELRKAGLRVKLVSLAGQPSSGVYGVTLVPDLTLEQALPLARYATAVVIPCGAAGFSRLQNDPRMAEFLVQTSQVGATFVVNQSGVADLESFHWTNASLPKVVVYADRAETMDAVREVVGSLVAPPPVD